MAVRLRVILIVVAVLTGWLQSTAVGLADELSFARDVLPILSENCFFCHGPDSSNREADLRLDTEADAAAVLGRDNPAESELLHRVLSSDPDLVMPPVDSNRSLSAAEQEVLSRWIRAGAPWGRHWSFEPLVAPAVPDRTTSSMPVHNAIDAFVQQRLQGMNLQPADEADRQTLIRRVTLDLTGLPATAAEVAGFTADESPDAYERLVDRLLQSGAYGERMAWDWLDAARYADSNGYQGDRERTMWPWRDWVVDAFNSNMPFDQFTIDQLAGDLLPDATFEQKLATGFNRNHMINGEGGRIAEENRVDYVMDMTETMGTVWLGLTLNCCRCHDHKYDPLQQKDYYQFFAYFNQTPVNGGGGDPQTAPNLSAPTAEQRQRLHQLDQQLAELDRDVRALADRLAPDQPDWEQKYLNSHGDRGWHRLVPRMLEADHQSLRVLSDGSVLAEGPNPANDAYRLTFEPGAKEVTGIRIDAIRHPSMTSGGLARSDSGNFVLTEVEIELRRPDGTVISLQPASSQATYEQGGLKVETTYDGNPSTGWAVYRGRPIDQDHAAVFVLGQPTAFASGDALHLTLRHDSLHVSHNLGRFAVSVSTDGKPQLDDDSGRLADIIRTKAARRTSQQQEALRDAFLKDQPEYTSLVKQRADVAKSRQDVVAQAARVMVMQDQPGIRNTFILDRGLYNQPTDVQVTANTPESLPPLRSSETASRLDLARWLVSDEQPLTARVTVNRFWQQLFGIGLVRTTEDFGVQGEYPQYKELLDWLATDFRDHGWDVKRLVKTMVMSHTYRQSSQDRLIPDPVDGRMVSLSRLDPQNRLLARGARYRMPAWMLRDQALAISGLMNRQQGGPSVNTYQPAGVWEEATFGNKKYVQDTGDQLYRRSLYVFWRRIVGPTVFFDNASRQVCSVKVLRTNTPLHSLLTMNETTFVECARVLAESVLQSQSAESDRERLQAAFLKVLARNPSDEELAVLLQGLHRSLSQYQANPEAAAQLLAIGESSRDETIAVERHAAWTSLCLTLLNLDETLTRE